MNLNYNMNPVVATIHTKINAKINHKLSILLCSTVHDEVIKVFRKKNIGDLQNSSLIVKKKIKKKRLF